MESNIFLELLLFRITLITLFVFNTSSQQVVKNLGLREGEICRKSLGQDPEYVCKSTTHCKAYGESIRTRKYLDVCTAGSKPIICCPAETTFENIFEIPKRRSGLPMSANEKCYQYSKSLKVDYVPVPINAGIHHTFSFKKKEWLKLNRTHHQVQSRLLGFAAYVAGGINAKLKEFPHMALIGYGTTTTNADDWRCGGSLISERWILTAAHCEKLEGNFARWARLGVLQREFKEFYDNRRGDYKIVRRVIHPDYKHPSRYNDIALFHLERDVEFSEAVRPICLNSYPSLTPLLQIATGWGRTSTAGPLSETLLKVNLEVFPSKRCNESYRNDSKLRYGILPGSMICAGSSDGRRDTCTGDSGGPLQVKHAEFADMFTQYGITSFGKLCADKNTPAVYTRVAKYISWIENIAFSKN